MMTLHQHQVGEFLKCPRLFYLGQIKKWTPKVQKRYINIGHLFAKGVEHIHKETPIDKVIREVVDPEARELMEKATSNEVIAEILTDSQVVESMLNGYKKWFLDENDMVIPKIDKIYPEHKIAKVITHDYLAIEYVNRLDGLCFDTNNNIWILEIKTSALDAGLLVRQLATNFQINSYYMMLSGSDKAHRLEGVVYRIVKKPTIRQKKNESTEQYRLRLHIDYLTRKDFYFQQVPIYFKESATIEFKTDFKQWIDRLMYSMENDIWPKNGFSCRAMYSECKFLKYCAEPTDETFFTFYKLKEDGADEVAEDRGNDEPDF